MHTRRCSTVLFFIFIFAANIALAKDKPGKTEPSPASAFVNFDTCFDLEGGVVAQSNFIQCLPEGDIVFVPGNPVALFWNEQFVDIAMLRGVPFDAVDGAILSDSPLFAVHINDPNYPVFLAGPFDPTDTAIVLTGDGNFYKVGYAVCEIYAPSISIDTECVPMSIAGTWGVRFKYQQIVVQ